MAVALFGGRESPPADARTPEESRRERHLLDLDPDLGVTLHAGRLAAARAELVVRTITVRRGEWSADVLRSPSPEHLGLLLIEGAIAREVLLGDTVSTELLAPGDFIRPWGHAGGPSLLEQRSRWQVLETATLALLDRRFGIAVARYPEVNTIVLDRLNARLERVATLKAIAQLNRVDRRVLALFWHLAERWGRVTRDGVAVPLTLSHRLVGELVGARRPTISAAVASLAATGQLARRADGTWLLPGQPEDAPSPAPGRTIPHRRKLLARE